MKDIWEIFYSPHTDDESIGMAGAIVNAKELGHKVLVCLVTDNVPSTRGQYLFPGDDTSAQRRKEWRNALHALNVDETQVWELPEAEMIEHTAEMRDIIRNNMLSLHESRTVAHHHTTWGLWDKNSGKGCLAHDLCACAAYEMAYTNLGIRVSLYAIYEYSKPKEERHAPVIRQLSIREHTRKRDALQAYCVGEDSIGYGYASVPELIDGARTDPREFIIEVQYGDSIAAIARE